MDCSPPGSSVHGIHQPRIWKWVAIFLTQGLNQHLLHYGFFTSWATREAKFILLEGRGYFESEARVRMRNRKFSSVQSFSRVWLFVTPWATHQGSLSITPGVYLNSYPLSWGYHPTIWPSVVPFSHLQSFPASGSFPMSQLFTSGGLHHLEARGKLGNCLQIPPLCPAVKTALLTIHRNDYKWNSHPAHILL